MHKRKWPTFWQRFWERVDRGEGCWLWCGLRLATGYGQIRTPDDSQELAHRVAWKWAYGEIPHGKYVLHRCDIKLCVRPDHLYLGGAKENARDAIEAGVLPRGANHSKGRLTHCPQGHPYDEANTYLYKGRRYCRACHKIHSLNYSRKPRFIVTRWTATTLTGE